MKRSKIQRSITIDPEIMKQVEKLARFNSRSASFIIEQAVREYIASHQAQPVA